MSGLRCPICNKPRDQRYTNTTAREECVDPCHWPYLTSDEVARASIALDRIRHLATSERNPS